MKSQLINERTLLISTISVLTILALFLNLGLMPFIGDEAIRCLVAMEMGYQNNYLVPTINGEFYFSKPPLYNWILILFFKIYGSINEWIARVPTVLFCLIFSWVIYKSYKSKFNDKTLAVLLSLMFLTCGRILFWDSFLALIDIFFSLLMFVLFMVIYHYGQQQKYSKLFSVSYIITFLGFMLKGFPAPVFLIITLATYSIIQKKWRYLYSKYHLFSALLFSILLAVYFYFYNFYINASQTVAPLLEQATKRTLLKYPIEDVIKHIFSYPFENVYHFLPWSIMILLCLRKDFFRLLKKNSFFNYTFWCFLANISIYWISPEVFPRYILMLVPLIFGVYLYFFEKELLKETWRIRVIRLLFNVIAGLLPIALLASLLSNKIDFIPYVQVKIVLIAFAMAVASYRYFKSKDYPLFYVVILVLLLRIFFDLVIMPSRATAGQYAQIKKESITIANKYEPLHIYKGTRFYFNNSYYVSITKNKLFDKKENLEQGHYYVVDSINYALKFRDSTIKLDSVMDGEFHKKSYVLKLK